MKTPEEIKKGLEFHYVTRRCKDCPYTADEEFKKTCFQLLSADALAYIQQLESLLGLQEAATRTAEQRVAELESRLAQAERERDAALYDLENSADACLVCKYFGEECRSRNELNECAFEWRGPCPENTKGASS